MNDRRGVTLVELIVVLTGCAVMLSISGQIIHRAMRSQSDSRRAFDGQRAAWRLATDFRRDAHAAIDATLHEDEEDMSEMLRLELHGSRVVSYTRDGANVVRTLTRPDGPEARETYAFPAGMKAEVRFDDAASVATMSIGADPAAADEAPPKSANEAPVHVDIAAQVGRDRRFHSEEPAEEGAP